MALLADVLFVVLHLKLFAFLKILPLKDIKLVIRAIRFILLLLSFFIEHRTLMTDCDLDAKYVRKNMIAFDTLK